MNDITALLRNTAAGLRVLLVITVVITFGYVGAVTAIAQLAFPWKAEGSLVQASGERTTEIDKAVGSALIGQSFVDGRFFHPRPSAAGEGYDPRASAGTNLGPNNADLVAAIEARRAEISIAEGVEPGRVPPDALTTSASGLDPHISPAYARLQAERVAKANGLSTAQVRELVKATTDARGLGVLGEPRISVLSLNIAIVELAGS